MQRTEQILNNFLNTKCINPNDFIYLLEHKQEVINTGNLELIDLVLDDEDNLTYKFNKIL